MVFAKLELGINFNHIGAKSLIVLNPLRTIDERIMDDADLAGPAIFCFFFALFLLFVRFPSIYSSPRTDVYGDECSLD